MNPEAVSRLVTARASLPCSAGLPVGLLLGSCDPSSSVSLKSGRTLHALLWAPLASLSSDPQAEQWLDAASFLQQLQQQQQQQLLDRLKRQAALCCSHHLPGGLAVLGLWARASAAAGQQQREQQLETLQRLLQAPRLAAALAEGPLQGLNACDEAAAAALLQQQGGPQRKQGGPLKQPFVFVLIEQQQQQQQEEVSVFFSPLNGGSTWGPLAAASLWPPPQAQAPKQQQQQQLLQLCCSPISVDLTLLVAASVLNRKASISSSSTSSSSAASAGLAGLLETADFHAALRGALRRIADIEGEPAASSGAGVGGPHRPVYCSARGLTKEDGASQQTASGGVPCSLDLTVGAAAAAAGAAAREGGPSAEAAVLQVELLCPVLPALMFFLTESGVSAAASCSLQQRQQELPRGSGFVAVRCRLSLQAVAAVPKLQTLKAVLEALIADWVRGAIRCIGSSLEQTEDADGCQKNKDGLQTAAVALHQRRLVMQRDRHELLLQQQQAHGSPVVLAELAAAAQVEGDEEGLESLRLEFLFGAEGAWHAVVPPAKPLGSTSLEVTLGAGGGTQQQGGKEPAASANRLKAFQAETQEYWRSLISSVRTEHLKVKASNRPWWIWLLPLLALLLSYLCERLR